MFLFFQKSNLSEIVGPVHTFLNTSRDRYDFSWRYFSNNTIHELENLKTQRSTQDLTDIYCLQTWQVWSFQNFSMKDVEFLEFSEVFCCYMYHYILLPIHSEYCRVRGLLILSCLVSNCESKDLVQYIETWLRLIIQILQVRKLLIQNL